MATEGAGSRGLRQLLDAVNRIGGELDFRMVLQHIIEAAVSLVDARYGALGVLDATGTRLVEFITVGVDDETREAIGPLPTGFGVLGSLIADARPLRVDQVTRHPDSVGFPPNHPAMSSFLGVPIRVRDEVFGNLYLADKTSAESFTDVDEEVVQGFAAAAAIAIENARVLEQTRRREATLAAMHEVATALIAGRPHQETLQLVAQHARRLTDSDVATIAFEDPDGETLEISVADGAIAGLLGERFPRVGSISGDVLRTRRMATLENLATDPRVHQPQVRKGDLGPAIFVAMVTGGKPLGTLSVARAAGANPFTAAETELLDSFAAQAGVVLELERGRATVERMQVLEGQERIARDLHDTVIQRLFATGLSLTGALRLVPDEAARERIEEAIETLDITVRRIRAVIFDVQRPSALQEHGVRAQVAQLAREAERALGFEPSIEFAGPVDAAVPDDLIGDLLATLREGLSNVAHHAHAHRVDINLSAGDVLLLALTDDGVGVDDEYARAGSGHGVANMTTRARRHGGDMSVSRTPGGGTSIRWHVPLGH